MHAMTPSSAELSRESLIDSRPRSDQDDDQLRDELVSDELSSPGPSRRSSHAPTQKRRRVTRACDECRRKKIKCDGKQPCTHCTVYSYECSYDQPSHRRRNPGPQYVEALEAKLHRAEALLRDLAPNVDLNDSSLDAKLNLVAPSSSNPRDEPSAPATHGSNESIPRPSTLSNSNSNSSDAGLESMVRSTGQLDLDDSGNWDYYGHSSGLSFLRRIRDQFGNVVSPEEAGGSRSAPFARTRSINQDFASPKSPNRILDSPYENSSDVGAGELPSREVALRLCGYALDDGGSILNLVYKPYFYKSFDRIYNLAPGRYENQDNRFLPLLYTVLALGCLFAKDGDPEIDGYEDATGKGYKFFWAAREMMDITDCRDLISLQAIIFMILFLQCSAKLSTCYSYIGIALRSALRMGLHRSFRDSFSPIEAETRKRTFWVIRKMDIYVGAMLGLPLTLSEQDFDQDLPTEVDDQYITETAIMPMPVGSVPFAAAANANFRLCKILSKIIKCIYPIKGFQNTEQDPSRTYSIGFATICELENDLQTWKENLPAELQPGGTKQPSHVGPMQQLLRMAYAHAQMMLYRPFLHYVSSRAPLMTVDPRSYACAAACISVSRNIIHITTEMTKEGLLIGSYWFTMYTTFFGVLSLLYFAVENPENSTTPEVMRDAKEGKETLAKLAKRSMAADRCTSTLNAVFQNLQGVFEKGAQTRAAAAAAASRKREASNSGHSNPQSQLDQPPITYPEVPRRASTIPPNAPQPLKPPHSSQRLQRGARTAPQMGRAYQQKPNASSSYPVAFEMREVPSLAPNHYVTPRFNQHGHFGQQQQQQQQQHQQLQQNQRQQQQQHQQHQQQQQDQEHQQQQYYSPQLHDSQFPGDISDLASMMFPSADPFAYPNQPMTTLEQNYAYNRNIPHSDNTSQGEYVPASTSASNTVSADEHIDVQLFGPLPTYITQATHNNMYGHDINTNHRGQSGPGADMWNNQMRTHGFGNFSYDEMFGNEDEWRGTFP